VSRPPITTWLNQYQDNGKTVGCLGGTHHVSLDCRHLGRRAYLHRRRGLRDSQHQLQQLAADADRALSHLEAVVDIRQFAEGSVIPVSSVFDVPGGNVLTPPKPTLAKTYQIGSVLKLNRFTLDMDAYYVHFQNGYDSYTDPTTGEPVFVATGPSNTKGVEAEGNMPRLRLQSLRQPLVRFGQVSDRPQLSERRRVGGQYARQRMKASACSGSTGTTTWA
jgi:hypothetical protein